MSSIDRQKLIEVNRGNEVLTKELLLIIFVCIFADTAVLHCRYSFIYQ